MAIIALYIGIKNFYAFLLGSVVQLVNHMKKAATNKSIIFQKIDNKLVGFDIERSSLYTFNETAEFIYKKMVTGMREGAIAKLVAKKYCVEEKTARKDIEGLAKDLKKNKIL